MRYYPPCIVYILSLIRVNESFVHSSRFAGIATQKRSGVDDSHQTECTTCPTLLNAYQFEQWHKLCEDVDKVLGSLVSPAPESFHILHSLLSKINDEVECFDRNFPAGKYNNDLKALSSFLIKENYSILLYLDSDLVKWKIEPGCINLCNDIQESQIELYHKHNTLELSRMASDIAAKNLSNPVISLKIHHLARQAEV